MIQILVSLWKDSTTRKSTIADCQVACKRIFGHKGHNDDSLSFARISCPWTGTAIGSKNMSSFQCFVALVFVCLILDIVLLTGGIP